MVKYMNSENNIPSIIVKKQYKSKLVLQAGSAMVEASMGMFVVIVMLLASIWYFQIMNFAVEEEIQAGIELREKLIEANDACLTDTNEPLEVDKTPSIKSSFNISNFIGRGNDEFETQITRYVWGGPCKDFERTGFHLSEDRLLRPTF